MRILFITAYPLEYNTSGNVRNLGVINGFINNGHSVSTLSPFPTDDTLFTGDLLDYPFEKRYWIGPKTKPLVIQTTNKLLLKLKGFVYRWINSFSVYDRRRLLVNDIKIGMIKERFDVIISSSDPKSAHLFAEKLLKTDPGICQRWIQYWGDPFTGDISNNHKYSETRIKKEEKRLIGMADKVIYVSPFTSECMKCLYPESAKKIDFLPIPYIETVNNKKKNNNTLIAYLGDYHSHNRNILPFIDAINEIKAETVIVGGSDLTIESNDHLMVKDRMVSKELDEIVRNVGIYVCICNLSGTQIPGKIYHYACTPYPILIILDGENREKLKDYFSTFERFYMCYNNKSEIVKMLQTIKVEKKVFTPPVLLSPSYIATEFIK